MGTDLDTNSAGATLERPDSTGTTTTWRFAGAELHDGQPCLWVAGSPHELDFSCHELLSCLLAEAGKVVPKDRLLRVGWPGRVVSENSLTKAIGRLRQALADPDGEILCTVHGYGYRLVAPVQRVRAQTHSPG